MTRVLATASLLLSLLSLAHASAELQLDGKIDGMTTNDFIILSGMGRYYVRKLKLPSALQQKLEKNPRGPVSIRVPMAAIDEVRPVSARSKK